MGVSSKKVKEVIDRLVLLSTQIDISCYRLVASEILATEVLRPVWAATESQCEMLLNKIELLYKYRFQFHNANTHLWGSAKTNFLSFRSRKTMPCLWHAATVSAICRNNLRASCSLSRFLALTYEWRSECDRGNIKYTLLSPTRTSCMGLTCGWPSRR